MGDFLYLEIAATGFVALIFFMDLVKKQLPTRKTHFFQLFLCIIMLDFMLSVDITLSKKFGDSLVLEEAVYAVSVFLQAACCVFLHMYILSLVYKLRSSRLASIVFGVIPMVIVSFLSLSSPVTKIAYWFDVKGQVHRTAWFAVGCAILAGNLILDISLLWRYEKRMSRIRKMFYTLFIVVFLIAIMLQVMGHPFFGLWHICLVFFLYIFYLSQQSPDFYLDNTTGHFNRNGFFEVLYERVGYKIPTSCLIIRVLKFDSMHQIYSAEILRSIQKEIGQILVQSSKEGTVFRVSSSAYAVILRSRSDTEVLYYRLRDKIGTTWNIGETLVNLEYEYSEVTYPEYGRNYEEIVQKIHYARSDHESQGKPGELIHLHNEIVQEAEEKKEISHLIEEAIMDQSIEIHFQPIFSFEKGIITSLEVLARLKNKNREYINPEYFIKIAEENHTIIELGLQIFRKACAFAQKNKIFEMGIENMSINLSPTQCRYDNLTEELVAIAKEYEVPMERIHLEITESEFGDQKAVEETLHLLKETGAKVALDDFGTGFSTLSNILDLPVDYVKIDKSLVWSFAEGKNQFLNDLMPMIKAEGKKIVAEGIESVEHIDIIKRLQGDYLQGYYYSKPLPEDEMLRYLERFNKPGERSIYGMDETELMEAGYDVYTGN